MEEQERMLRVTQNVECCRNCAATNKPTSFSSQSLIYPTCEMGSIAEPVETASPGGVCACY